MDALQLTCEIVVLLVKSVYFWLESAYKLFVPPAEVSVKGEIVLVTGSGHGIGKQLAIQYASHGATVVCWDINKENNDKTVEEIKSKGGKAHGYVCNVMKREEVFEVVEKVKSEVGDVSIIVNNAGIMPTHPLLQQTQSEIERTFGINVFAHFWIMQAILPSMIKNKHGHIVAISSCAGLFGLENLVPYCASKFAVLGMMEAMYQELKLYPNCNVKITTFCPYIVDTGLCKKPRVRFEITMKALSPEEVAGAIISAQRRGVKVATLPSYMLYLNNVLRCGPLRAADSMKDFIGSGLDSDL